MDNRPFVLLVEDDPANRALASRILEVRGYSHAVAVDGESALAQIATHCPDLILMHLSMPGLDGWATTRAIRRDPACAGVRILAVTAHAMTGDRERALTAGCDDVLTKPYRPAELIAAIERTMAGPLVAATCGA